MIPTANEIVARVTAEIFARPLVTNVHRAAVVEAIVATALEPDWTWCSGDYASCDFRHKRSGARLEVKQSASLQSWNAKDRKESRCSFDIEERTGEWVEGVTWVERQGRNADFYLFCHHPVTTQEADHREPRQWRFFLVPATALPAQKTIGLRAVEALAEAMSYRELRRGAEPATLRAMEKAAEGGGDAVVSGAGRE